MSVIKFQSTSRQSTHPTPIQKTGNTPHQTTIIQQTVQHRALKNTYPVLLRRPITVGTKNNSSTIARWKQPELFEERTAQFREKIDLASFNTLDWYRVVRSFRVTSAVLLHILTTLCSLLLFCFFFLKKADPYLEPYHCLESHDVPKD